MKDSLPILASSPENFTYLWRQTIRVMGHISSSLSLLQVNEGQTVAAPFMYDEKWYRAEVAKISTDNYEPEETVLTLYYVDYGDTLECKKENVFELRTDFLRLRFQAIECILAKVKPRYVDMVF